MVNGAVQTDIVSFVATGMGHNAIAVAAWQLYHGWLMVLSNYKWLYA